MNLKAFAELLRDSLIRDSPRRGGTATAPAFLLLFLIRCFRLAPLLPSREPNAVCHSPRRAPEQGLFPANHQADQIVNADLVARLRIGAGIADHHRSFGLRKPIPLDK